MIRRYQYEICFAPCDYFYAKWNGIDWPRKLNVIRQDALVSVCFQCVIKSTFDLSTHAFIAHLAEKERDLPYLSYLLPRQISRIRKIDTRYIYHRYIRRSNPFIHPPEESRKRLNSGDIILDRNVHRIALDVDSPSPSPILPHTSSVIFQPPHGVAIRWIYVTQSSYFTRDYIRIRAR